MNHRLFTAALSVCWTSGHLIFSFFTYVFPNFSTNYMLSFD